MNGLLILVVFLFLVKIGCGQSSSENSTYLIVGPTTGTVVKLGFKDLKN